MMKRLGLLTLTLTAGLMLTTGSVLAERATPTHAAANSPLENTERNARDSSGATLTPEDQKETPHDRQLTAAIRRAVVKDKSLSIDAHNAKIITPQWRGHAARTRREFRGKIQAAIDRPKNARREAG